MSDSTARKIFGSKSNMTDEQKEESRKNKINNLSAEKINYIVSYFQSLIDKPHPTIKESDIDREAISFDLYEKITPVSKELKKFQDQKKALEREISQSQNERAKDWQGKAIRGDNVEISPEMVEQLEKLSAHIAECARYIAGLILHKFGLAEHPGEYRRELTQDEIHQLNIEMQQNQLMQTIAKEGDFRDNVEESIDSTLERRKQELNEWSARPEVQQALDYQEKLESILLSSDEKTLFDFKSSIALASKENIIAMIDKFSEQEPARILKGSSFDM